MSRTPQEVFQHHAESLGAGDLDEILADYSADAVLITPSGPNRGHDAIRAVFTKLLADVPAADWKLPTMIYEDDALLLEWTADAGETFVTDGLDTFLFLDGKIRLQTVRYTLQSRG